MAPRTAAAYHLMVSDDDTDTVVAGTSAPWEQQVTTAGGAMPPEMWAATIASNGALTPPFEYIESMRAARQRSLSSSSPATRPACQVRKVLVSLLPPPEQPPKRYARHP